MCCLKEVKKEKQIIEIQCEKFMIKVTCAFDQLFGFCGGMSSSLGCLLLCYMMLIVVGFCGKWKLEIVFFW